MAGLDLIGAGDFLFAALHAAAAAGVEFASGRRIGRTARYEKMEKYG